MSYRVLPTARAEADLERLYASIVERRGEKEAGDWYDAYDEGLGRLLTRPYSCGLAYENPVFHEEVRHLLFGSHPKRKYRALFLVRGEDVVILAVRAPGERPIEPDDVPTEH